MRFGSIFVAEKLLLMIQSRIVARLQMSAILGKRGDRLTKEETGKIPCPF
jgi:hypothetical protein